MLKLSVLPHYSAAVRWLALLLCIWGVLGSYIGQCSWGSFVSLSRHVAGTLFLAAFRTLQNAYQRCSVFLSSVSIRTADFFHKILYWAVFHTFVYPFQLLKSLRIIIYMKPYMGFCVHDVYLIECLLNMLNKSCRRKWQTRFMFTAIYFHARA
jgi:hypothetical protein